MQEPSYRLELLRVRDEDAERTASLLVSELRVDADTAAEWTSGAKPKVLRAAMNVGEAERVAKLLAGSGAYVAVINERTGSRRSYPSEPPPEEPRPTTRERVTVFEPEPTVARNPARAGAVMPSRASAVPKKLRDPRPEAERVLPKAPSGPREKVSLATVLTPAQRKRLLIIAAVALVLGVVLHLWSRPPAELEADEVDGPYEFGPRGYDFQER
jgi:hypothetical protein